MKVVITSATEREIIQIKQKLQPLVGQDNAALEVSFHESGVGLLASCFSIAKLIFTQKPDLIIQAGIAGAFDADRDLGALVAVKDEILGDTGVEENGAFKDLFDLNLQQENIRPFTARMLSNPFLTKYNLLQLDEVTGITINEITTRRSRIEALQAKYNPAIETMEGASLHYCCLQTSTPFIQIRAISNYIGERDKTKWNFADAFTNVSECIAGYVSQLESRINKGKKRNDEIYDRI